MKRLRSAPVTALALLALALACGCERRTDRVIVGSKNFSEQVLLGEIVAQAVERAGGRVDRRLNLGGTFLCDRAIRAGEIDVYVEYSGTALTAILKKAPIADPAAVREAVRSAYAEAALEWGEPFGFDNTFAIVVRGDDAERLGLRSLSDAAPHARGWRAGFGYEFMERADGFPGLARAYGLTFREPPRVMDLGLLYRALVERQVDLVAGNSTDGLISSLGLRVLDDDRHYFPPYEAAPVARREALERHPALRSALASLAGRISGETMRRLNHRVDGERVPAEAVAREFLSAQ